MKSQLILFVGLITSGSGQTLEDCYLPVDVYFLQDTTGSFIPDLPIIKAQIPSIITSIDQHNPGSKFGVGQFRDKPFHNLGELSDFCTKLTHPLSTDIPSVETAFETLFASGGGDLPEAQLEAIIESVNDALVGWRPVVRDVVDPNISGARLIIMSTDAKPHDPLDYELYPDTCPAYMIPYPDDISGISQNTLCRRYDYPTPEQMKAQLSAHNTYLAILTPDDDPEVTAKWRWINDEVLGNPAGFYQFIKNDSSDILQAILSVLSEVTQYLCLQTTPVPTVPTDVTSATVPDVSVVTQATVPEKVTCPPIDCPPTEGDHCQNPCYNACACCSNYGLYIEINDRPDKLIVNYTK